MQVINPGVASRADELAARFAAASPFRHCVIEEFFEPGFARALLEQFPGFEQGDHLNEDGRPGGKSTHERMRELGDGYRALDELVASPAFLAMLGRITGIDDLRYDPMYFGGGTHENRDGQALDLHIDFNYHPLTGWHRRLNLIVHLNPEWEPSWGGALALHRDPYDPAADSAVQILPLFNRGVVFETTERSWHGFDRITLPAGGATGSRRSVAFYFYTEARPAGETAPTHSTVYVDRDLPGHLVPGHTLSAADCQALQAMLHDQHGHSRRLYRQIEQLQAELERSPLGRLLAMLRRRLARWRMRR